MGESLNGWFSCWSVVRCSLSVAGSDMSVESGSVCVGAFHFSWIETGDVDAERGGLKSSTRTKDEDEHDSRGDVNRRQRRERSAPSPKGAQHASTG